MEVPRTSTSLTPAQMVQPLIDGHQVVAGQPPTVTMLELVLGIIGLENANGRAIQNHNWGNVMAGPSWQQRGDYWHRCRIPEVCKPHPGQPMYFRAHATHKDGAADFWRQLYNRPSVLDAAIRGDVPAMVQALYETKYVVAESKGEVQRYTDGVAALVKQYQDAQLFRVGEHPAPPQVAVDLLPSAGLVAAGLGALGLVGGVILERALR